MMGKININKKEREFFLGFRNFVFDLNLEVFYLILESSLGKGELIV